MKLRSRAMVIHGRVACVETRGPKHSLFLSVYQEARGTLYVVRRGLYSGKEILRHSVR